MAQSLKDFPVQDFSGGLVVNKSDYELDRNQCKRLINYDIDERGRLKTRRGYQQFGTDLAGVLDSAIALRDPSSYTAGLFWVFDRGSNSNVYCLLSSSLENILTTSDTTATVGSTTGFKAATSTIEIEGDIITYTAKPSGTTFTTTASTILKQHNAGYAVNQFSVATATGIDSRSGLYTCSLDSQLFLFGRGATVRVTNYGTPAFTGVTTSDGLFSTVYRDRIYVAGSGGSGTNAAVNRISWSNAGTGITWTTTDFFDVEDQNKEIITGLRNYKDRLLIFKQNSIYYYDEVQMKKLTEDVGAYNHRVVEEIDGILYTFCPSGVFKTTGGDSKKISEPIEDILRRFYPKYDSQYSRVINNCCSAQYEKKYILYLGNIFMPSAENQAETLRSVALVYDTEKDNWTMYTYGTNVTFTSFLSTKLLVAGGNSSDNRVQAMQSLFGVSDDGFVYRMFEDRHIGFDSASNVRGGDIVADKIANSLGTPISTDVETPMFDFGNASWWKRFGFLRMLVEQGDFNVSYKLDKGDYITDPVSLGNFTKPNKRERFIDNEGFRVGLRITSNQLANRGKTNGFILEDNEAISKQERRS